MAATSGFRRLRNGFHRVTSKAPKIQKPPSGSTYSASRGIPLDWEHLVTWVTPFPREWETVMNNIGNSKYDLSELIGDCNVTKDYNADEIRKAAHEGLQKWINGILESLGQNESFEAVFEKHAKAQKKLVPIFVSSTVIPDVTLVTRNDGIAILEMEVNSSPYEGTLDKVGLDLIDQLRWLRHCDPTLEKWTGFAFPKLFDKAAVSEVTITWKDDELLFELTFVPLQLRDVKRRIETVIDNLLSTFQSKIEGHMPDPKECLPGIVLSDQFLEKEFGPTAWQIPASQAIVVQAQTFIYKYHWNHSACRRITDLMHLVKDDGKDTEENPAPKTAKRDMPFLIPRDVKWICNKMFFESQLLDCPCRQEDIKNSKSLRKFAESVSKAIQFVHTELKIAHLDIRLENVCWRNGSSMISFYVGSSNFSFGNPR